MGDLMDWLGPMDSGDESDDEASRREEIAKRKAETEAIKLKRELQRKREEERRFPKQQKIESLSFAEHLTREGYLLSVERKPRYKNLIQRVVDHFGGGKTGFMEKMKKIKNPIDLRTHILNCHTVLVTDPITPEATELHDALVEFHKEILMALCKMTQIPTDAKIVASSGENVFFEAKELLEAKKTTAISSDHILKILNDERLAEQREQESLLEAAAEMMDDLNIKGSLAKELTTRALQRITDPQRDTSPDRTPLSKDSLDQISDLFRHLFVQKPAVLAETNDWNASMFGMEMDPNSDDDEYNPNDPNLCKPSPAPPPPYTTWQGSTLIKNEWWDSDDEVIISSDEDFDNVATDNNTSQNRENESENTATAHLNWNQRKLQDRRKRYSKVKFVEYDDQRNNMRFFIPPNTHFFEKGDDGPHTDYVDMTLRDGSIHVYKTPFPMSTCQKPFSIVTQRRLDITYMSEQQKITLPCPIYMQKNCCGNLLGRFWFQRLPPEVSTYSREKMNQDQIALRGFLRFSTEEEVVNLYKSLVVEVRETMIEHAQISIELRNERIVEARKEKMALGKSIVHVPGVLILTDWRLAHFDKTALTNAIVQFVPTNLGEAFFETLITYLITIIQHPRIDFHTIIFAFGGSPLFTTALFKKFFTKLINYTTKSIDVFWMAQDWCDGVESERTQEELDAVVHFNDYVRKMFGIMRNTGHRNYKWCNIRELYNIPTQPFEWPLPMNPDHAEETPVPVGPVTETPVTDDPETYEPDVDEPIAKHKKRDKYEPDTDRLQNLYFAYLTHFVNECNCYAKSNRFSHNPPPDQDDYDIEDSRRPKRPFMQDYNNYTELVFEEKDVPKIDTDEEYNAFLKSLKERNEQIDTPSDQQ